MKTATNAGEVNGHDKTYAGRNPVTALTGVDLAVGDGEFVAILGPSGCGKSTLLNIVAGFEPPTAGEARLDGQTIRGPRIDRGVVFQEYALFPWLTVQQNVEYGLREQRLPRAEVARRSAHYLHLVGL